MKAEQRIIDEAACILDLGTDLVRSWFEAFVATVGEAMDAHHAVTVGNLGVLLPAMHGPRFLPATLGSGDIPNQPLIPFSRIMEETAHRAGISTETCTIIAHAVLDSIRQRLSTGEAVSFEALGTWAAESRPAASTSQAGEDEFPFAASTGNFLTGAMPSSTSQGQEDMMEHPSTSTGERKAVDLARIVREVTTELGLPLPVHSGSGNDTGEENMVQGDPSNAPLDINAIGRLAREYIRKTFAEPQRSGGERSFPPVSNEEGTPRDFDPIIPYSARTNAREETPPLDASTTEGKEADSREIFEQNRQHLFHPPVSSSRRSRGFILLIAAVIAVCILLFLGWMMNLFDPVLPQWFKHANGRIERLSVRECTTPGLTLTASITTRPLHPASSRSTL
ncbi:MAG: hypothetical protein QHI48_02515 [Bacteroidota bacterium]|nr:hypothetical protein [Bacteroidota bacterium]